MQLVTQSLVPIEPVPYVHLGYLSANSWFAYKAPPAHETTPYRSPIPPAYPFLMALVALILLNRVWHSVVWRWITLVIFIASLSMFLYSIVLPPPNYYKGSLSSSPSSQAMNMQAPISADTHEAIR